MVTLRAVIMATIRQRGTKWQAIIKRQGYPSHSKSFELKKDAEKWARQQERLIDAGEWIDQTQSKVTTLADLLDRYQSEVTSTKRGKDIETLRIACIKRSSIAKYSVAAISGQLLADYRDTRLKTVKGSTVNRELSLLSHVFTIAFREWGYDLHINPASLVRKPPEGKARDRVLNATQREALIASCGQCANPWVKPVVIFALETAARRGEILALTWDGVDLKHGIAKVSGKTGSRSIPLSPACISMLKTLPRSIDGHVFPITIETIKQAYQRAVRRAGISDFTFHDLRHDALTRLANMGFNVLELRAISGHTTANMLQRYVSINANDLAGKLATFG
jgi:integrase